MSYFKIIIPEETTNLILDPVAGAADPDTSWDIDGDDAGKDVIRYTLDAIWDTGCFKFDLGAGTYTILYQEVAVTATSYTFSCYIKRSGGGALTSSQAQCWFNSAAVNFTTITLIRDGWYYCEYTGTPDAATKQFGIKALEDNLLADGCQLEQKAYATTLAYGDREGFRPDGYVWNGQVNASTSTRHAHERGGGKVNDIETDLGAKVTSFTGGGALSEQTIMADPAGEPGAIYQDNKILPRTIDLGLILHVSGALPHSERSAVYEAMKPRKVKPVQPFILRYTGGSKPVEIACRLDEGLGGGALQKFVEKGGVRLLCDDPFWRGIGNGCASLPVDNDALATNFYLIKRDQAGLTDLSGSINALVRTLARDETNNITYVGGDMTAPGNYALALIGSTLSALSTGPGGAVYALAVYYNILYAGINGALKKWDGSNWSTDATVNSGTIYALAARGGRMAVGGKDLRLSHVGLTVFINGSPSVEVAVYKGNTSTSGTVYAAAVGLDGAQYIAGDFTQVAAVAAANVAMRSAGGTVAAMGAGLSEVVRALAVNPVNGQVWAAGDNGLLACWNGAAWIEIDTGLVGTDDLFALAFDSNGHLIVCGDYDYGIGADSRLLRVAQFGPASAGGDFYSFGARFSTLSQAAIFDKIDQAFVGGDGANVCQSPGLIATVNNTGKAPARPVLKFTGDGGASVEAIINYTTGQTIYFDDFQFQTGEVIWLDLRPYKKQFISDRSGDVSHLLKTMSNLNFELAPGLNTLGILYNGNDSILEASLTWAVLFDSVDGAA